MAKIKFTVRPKNFDVIPGHIRKKAYERCLEIFEQGFGTGHYDVVAIVYCRYTSPGQIGLGCNKLALRVMDAVSQSELGGVFHAIDDEQMQELYI